MAGAELADGAGAAADTTADTADVTGAAADATGAGAAGAGVADGAGAAGAGAAGAGAKLADGAGAAADTTADTADVTGAAADATGAGTAGAELADGAGAAEGAKVAACACRVNTSKTTRIPAAAIATCIARRAMCRKIGCGIEQLPTTGIGQTRAPRAPHQRPETRRRTFISGFFAEGHPEPDIGESIHKFTYCSVITVQDRLGPGQGNCGSRLISANFGVLESQ